MRTPVPDWEHWNHHIVQWATARRDIRVVVAIGSRARRAPPADEVSDLDLMLYVDDLQSCTTSDWLPELGAVLVSVYERWPRGIPEYLVFFDDTTKVDFAFLPIAELQAAVDTATLPDGFQRGYAVLLDKIGLTARLPALPATPTQFTAPDSAEFLRIVNSFWFWALRTAQAIWRGEVWVAMTRYRKLQDHLLQMIEWHAHVIGGETVDTWHGGRFITKWAAPEIVARLNETGFTMDTAGAWCSLGQMTGLFGDVSEQCAAQLGLPYPHALAQRIEALITSLRDG
jgi:hypothetical protein